MDSFNEAWTIICDYCKEKITDVAYNTWISRMEPVSLDFDKGQTTLMVPGEFHKDTIERCYKQLLNEAFSNIFGTSFEICLVTPQEQETKETEDKAEPTSIYDYTFSNFIVGPSNKFAHAAAQAVAAEAEVLEIVNGKI